jgi:hypothetical protein
MYESYVGLDPGAWTRIKIVVAALRLNFTSMALSNPA